MNQTLPQASLLSTKQHFEILDGLRGVAAIAVLVFHFMEFVVPDYNDSFIAHGYLAVDFFFCLSGFVIAYAYDSRIAKLGPFNFIKLRLIRLHPLVIIGAIIGLLAFVLDPFSTLFMKYGWGESILMFLSSSLMVPYPLVHERYFNLFHLNPPTWSLFWEYVANIFYALFIFKLGNKLLLVLTLVAAILLWYVAYDAKQLGVGWSGDNFWGGGARVSYSFLAGMLVYRSKWIIKNKLGFTIISILLLGAFLVPFSEKVNWVTEPLLIIFHFPLLVSLGAGATLTNTLNKTCNFLGNISYPLYMIHYPFLWILCSYIEKYKPNLREMTIITMVGTILLISFAYLAMVFIDEPIRKWLKAKFKRA